MNIPAPFNWMATDRRTFEQVLRGLNWKKDDFGFYILVNNRERFAIESGNHFLIDPLYLISRLNK